MTLHDGSVHHITTDGRPIQQSAAEPATNRFLDAEEYREDTEEEYGIEATIDADGQLVVTGISVVESELRRLQL